MARHIWPEFIGSGALQKPVADVALELDRNYLKRFEGVYEITTDDQQKIEIAIQLLGSKLIYVVCEDEFELIPESSCVFSFKGMAGLKLQFVLDDSGAVAKAQIVMLPSNTVAEEAFPKA